MSAGTFRATPVVLQLGGSSAVALVAGWALAEQRLFPLAVLGLGCAGAVALVERSGFFVFLTWLALAPFFQGVARTDAGGRLGYRLLYLAPPLLLVLWSLRGEEIRWRKADCAPAAFLLLAAASLVWHGASRTSGTGDLLRQLYANAGVGVIAYYYIVRARRFDVTIVLQTLMMSGVIVALMALIEAFTGWNLWHYEVWQQVDVGRAVGPLANPVVLGTFVGASVVIAVAALVSGGATTQGVRRIAITTIVVGLPAVFVTYTRASVIAVIFVAGLILVSRPQTRLLAVVATGIACVGIFASWDSIVSSSVYSVRVENRTNIQARQVLAQWSFNLGRERPLFGWGYGHFDDVKNGSAFSSAGLPADFGYRNTSHNTFLTVFVELGSLGIALLLWPWLSVLRRIFHGFPTLSWQQLACVSVICIFAINASTIDMRFFSIVPATAWIALGMLRRLEDHAGTNA